MKQKESPHQKPTHQHFDSGIPSNQNCEKYISVASKHFSLWDLVSAAPVYRVKAAVHTYEDDVFDTGKGLPHISSTPSTTLPTKQLPQVIFSKDQA